MHRAVASIVRCERVILRSTKMARKRVRARPDDEQRSQCALRETHDGICRHEGKGRGKGKTEGPCGRTQQCKNPPLLPGRIEPVNNPLSGRGHGSVPQESGDDGAPNIHRLLCRKPGIQVKRESVSKSCNARGLRDSAGGRLAMQHGTKPDRIMTMAEESCPATRYERSVIGFGCVPACPRIPNGSIMGEWRLATSLRTT